MTYQEEEQFIAKHPNNPVIKELVKARVLLSNSRMVLARAEDEMVDALHSEDECRYSLELLAKSEGWI